MLDYIWLDDNSPILDQLPHNFTSAAILLHPFVQMPMGWGQNKRENEHIYPTDEEILKYGKPVSWDAIINKSKLSTYEELAVALKTSIAALRREYAREDLADKLKSSMESDLYYLDEDFPTVFLVNDLLNLLSSKGAKKLSYSDPILDKRGNIELKNLNALGVSELSLKEVMITDENMDFSFMNVYDSFITIIMAKGNDINNIVSSINLEAIVCSKNTYINWYSKA
nr:DUF2711 family protein [Aquibacillus albus]